MNQRYYKIINPTQVKHSNFKYSLSLSNKFEESNYLFLNYGRNQPFCIFKQANTKIYNNINNLNFSNQATLHMQTPPKQLQPTNSKSIEKFELNTNLSQTLLQNPYFASKLLDNSVVSIKIQNQISEPYEHLQNDESGSNNQVIPAAGKKQSIYHNFQKHLVNTLKMHINLAKCRHSNKTSDKLMLDLWQYFIKSNKPTKRYLYSLLMNIPENIIQHKNQCKDKIYHEQFKNIMKKATPQEIKIAQSNLRLHLIQQSKQIVTNGLLNNRRMHKIDQFKSYFDRFIQDLEKGVLNLRIPKQNSIQNGLQQEKKEINQMKKQKEYTVLKEQPSQ